MNEKTFLGFGLVIWHFIRVERREGGREQELRAMYESALALASLCPLPFPPFLPPFLSFSPFIPLSTCFAYTLLCFALPCQGMYLWIAQFKVYRRRDESMT